MTAETERPAGAGKAVDETWDRLRDDAENGQNISGAAQRPGQPFGTPGGLTGERPYGQQDGSTDEEDGWDEEGLEDEAPSDDPMAEDDTIYRPGNPSEYDRQRDAGKDEATTGDYGPSAAEPDDGMIGDGDRFPDSGPGRLRGDRGENPY